MSSIPAFLFSIITLLSPLRRPMSITMLPVLWKDERDTTRSSAGSSAPSRYAVHHRRCGGRRRPSRQQPQATLQDAGFPQIDNANNYPSLKKVHFVVLVAKRSWYEGTPHVAVNVVRAWAAITAWIYDAANRDEVIPIIKRTMNVSDAPAENTYTAHIGRQVVTGPPHPGSLHTAIHHKPEECRD